METKESVDRGVTDDVSPKLGFLNGSALSTENTVSITVVGASGDLAKKKIFPALFALYYEGCLPKVCLLNYWLPLELVWIYCLHLHLNLLLGSLLWECFVCQLNVVVRNLFGIELSNNEVFL